MPGGKKPPHKRSQAVAALIELGSVEAAAARAGVAEKTLRLWLEKDAGFRADYSRARRKLVDRAVLLLQHAATKAVAALVRELEGDKAPDRIRAAVAILEFCLRGTEFVDLAEAVEQLGRELEEVRGHAGRDAQPPGGPDEGGPGPPVAGRVGPAGEPAGGPQPHPGRGGDAPGPLADDAAPLLG